jgi:hypothetical protein
LGVLCLLLPQYLMNIFHTTPTCDYKKSEREGQR